jgi:hypothetical protein
MSKVKSKVLLEEEVLNTERKFGSDTKYFPAYVKFTDGEHLPAMFTLDQIEDAIERANKNPEDMPKMHKKFLGIF